MPYDISKMREKLKSSMGGRPVDPNEFRPPKAQPGQEIKYRFYVLPPLSVGDKCATGEATKDMDIWFVPYGQHWINSKPYACPRIASEGATSCPMCDKGFALLKEAKAAGAEKIATAALAKQWLPQVANMVNIYFPPHKSNPDELHGKVLFFKLPKSCFDQLNECLNKDDAGNDDERPEAFGAFFDEESAFVYELSIKRKGDYNDYSGSKFLTGNPKPIAAKADGTPDRKAIQRILDQRHDLWTKGDVADVKLIKKLVSKLMDGDDEDEEHGGGFDHDEVAEGKTRTQARPAHRTEPDEDEDERPKSAARRAEPEEDDEDERPKAKTSGKPKTALDDEEEVVPPPVAKSGKKTAAAIEVDDLISQLNDD